MEIETRMQIEACSEGEIVVLTLPLSRVGPAQIMKLKIELQMEEAEYLAAQIQPAAKMARVRVKKT
jgi:hypothetical protein